MGRLELIGIRAQRRLPTSSDKRPARECPLTGAMSSSGGQQALTRSPGQGLV